MPFRKKSFEERLDESGIVVILGEINSQTASKIIFRLLALSATDEKQEIQIFISSQGGSYLDVMSIYDTLSTIKNPISVVAVGSVSGYAVLLLAKCTRGKRYALKHTKICFSQPYAYLAPGSNQQTEIAIEAKEVGLKRQIFEQELAKLTQTPLEKIHLDCENGVNLSAEQAKEYGVIDDVL